MLSRSALGKQLRSANIGWSADITPVPKTGRVRFSQIGNLANIRHSGEKNIDLSQQKYQQMLGNDAPVKPIDPEAWRGVIWYMGKNINKGEELPPPNPDSWNEGFVNNWNGSLSSTVYDEPKNALFAQAQTPPNTGDPRTFTALIYYVGKMPVDTKVKVSCEIAAQNEDRYSYPVYLHTRGWSDGWFSGDGIENTEDYFEYLKFERNSAIDFGAFKPFEEEFTVKSGAQDIWVAFEVGSNDPYETPNNFNMGWVRNLKIELA